MSLRAPPGTPKTTCTRQTAMTNALSISRVHRRRTLPSWLMGSAGSLSATSEVSASGVERTAADPVWAFNPTSRSGLPSTASLRAFFNSRRSRLSVFSCAISALRFRLAVTSSRVMVPSDVSSLTTRFQSFCTKCDTTSKLIVRRLAISRIWSAERTLVPRRKTVRAAAFSALVFASSVSFSFASAAASVWAVTPPRFAATCSRISASFSRILSSSSRRTTLWRMVRSFILDQVFLAQMPMCFSGLSPFLASRDDGKAPFMSGLVTYVCGTPGWIFFLEPSATLSRDPSLPLNVLSSSRQNTPWPALVSTRHVRQAPEPSTGVPSSSVGGDLVWNRASSASLYTPVSIFSTISIVLSHLSKLASFVSAFCLVLIAATRAARFAVLGGERVPTRAIRWSGANSPRRLPFNASV